MGGNSKYYSKVKFDPKLSDTFLSKKIKETDVIHESSIKYTWPKLLAGVSFVEDVGDGIIHPNEPAQICVLSRSIIEVIDSGKNINIDIDPWFLNYKRDLAKHFTDIKMNDNAVLTFKSALGKKYKLYPVFADEYVFSYSSEDLLSSVVRSDILKTKYNYFIACDGFASYYSRLPKNPSIDILLAAVAKWEEKIIPFYKIRDCIKKSNISPAMLDYSNVWYVRSADQNSVVLYAEPGLDTVHLDLVKGTASIDHKY